MERVADEVAQAPADPDGSSPVSGAEARAPDVHHEATFSPDPEHRTDRYRLVTPFLLRL